MWHTPSNDPQGFGELESGEVGTEAVVGTTAKGQHRCRTLPGDVDTIRGVVYRGIAVGGRGVGEDATALRDENAAQFDVGGRDTKRRKDNR